MEGAFEDFYKRNVDEFKKVKREQKGIIDFFMGQIMKASKGKANPKKVRELLIAELNSKQ